MKVTAITGESDTSQVSTATHLSQRPKKERDLSPKFRPNALVAAVSLFALLLGSGGAQAQSYKILYSFSGASGANSFADLIRDASGNLYGSTFLGGANGYGTVFELVNSSGSYSEKVLYSFTGAGGDGEYPGGTLLMDGSGNLYGTTEEGGTNGAGTVFELVNSSGSYNEKVLYSFLGSGGDGDSPAAGLIMDASGNLYGTTFYGGNFSGTEGDGTVFELVNSSGSYSEKVLHSFTGPGGDGKSPWAGLIMDASGNLYGTTVEGGTGGDGIVFELVNSSGSYSEKVLYNFTESGGDGGDPFGSLIMDASGNLYGTTEQGGAGFGGIAFKLVNSSGTYSENVLYSFVYSTGSAPNSSLIMDASGNLYGTTLGGGTNGDGTVFELVNSSGTYSEKVLHNFTGTGGDGSSPNGLLMDASGNLYGTTAYNGVNSGDGIVFGLDNTTSLSAPAFTSTNATTFLEGVAGSFTVSTSGSPAAALAESGTLPSGVTFTDNGNGTGTLAGTPASGSAGTYPITLTASNSVGSTPQSFTLTVDVGVAITSGTSTTFTVGSAGSFTVTTVGTPTPALSETGSLPSGVTFVDNGDGTGTLSGTPASGTTGNYPITFNASNSVSSGTQNFTLTVNQGPAITSGSATTFAVGTAGSFLVTATGTPTPALSETGTLPAGVTFVDNGNGTAALSGTPAAGSGGSYPLLIKAANGVGSNATQSFTLTINQSLAITSGSMTTFTVGATGFFSVTTTGFPAPALTESGSLPSGVTFTDNGNGTATLTGTPAADTGGSYPITITASNGGADPNAMQSFTLVVNQGAAILTGNSTTFTVGAAGSFTVSTAGVPVAALTEKGALPGGVTFVDNGNGTGTLSGTPVAGSGGTYAITFSANNGVGTAAMQSFTLTVNQGPAITSTNTATFTEQVAGSFTVTTSGDPTAALSETGTLPSGVTFVDNGNGTATLSGTPAAGTSGQYGFTIQASNGVAPNATQTFTLTVTTSLHFSNANAATFTVAAAGTFAVTTSGQPTPSLTVTGTLPAGVTFSDNGNGTGTLAGTPAAGSAGVYPLTFTANNGANPNVTQAFTLTVDQAPSLVAPGNVTLPVDLLGKFVVSAGGFPTPTLTESGALPNGMVFSPNGTVSGVPTIVGTYTLTFTASNGVGPNATATTILTIVNQSAPVITSANTTTFAAGLAQGNCTTVPYNCFTVTTTGSPVPKLTATSIVAGKARAFPYFTDNGNGTATIAFAPSGSGTIHLTITATGADGAAVTQAFTLQVVPLPGAPVFSSADQATFTEGEANSFTVAAGPFVDLIRVTSGSLPYGITLTDNHDGTATLSGSANRSGVYPFTITASNPAAPVTRPYTGTQSFTLHVLPSGDSAPVITSANTTTFAAGLAQGNCTTLPYNCFTVTTTGSPVPKLTATSIVAGKATAFLYFTDNGNGTATIAFAPSGPGTIHLTITATGADGAAVTQAFTLQVVPLPGAPVFSSADQAIFTEGEANSFTVAAGPFVDLIRMPPGSLPYGITLTDNHYGTATLSGSANGTGVYSFTITASNPAVVTRPYTGTQSFMLTVLPPGDSAPVITSANTTTFAAGLAQGNCTTLPYNCFTVTTTGSPVPKLTATYTVAGKAKAFPYFTDNGNGTATIAFAPQGPETEQLIITATGADRAAVTQAFTLQVVPLPGAPVFSSADQATFTAGEPSNFTVAAGPFVDLIEVSSGSLPYGITLTDNHDGTATLSGSTNSTGPYQFTITASNPAAPVTRPYTGTQTFTLSVLP